MYTLTTLADGVYLETSKERLRWGISREQAWRIGNPRRYVPEDDTRILWEDKILGGLPCRLWAYLPDNAILDRIDIRLAPSGVGLEGSDALRAADDYLLLFNRFTEYFGPPKISAARSLPAPGLEWKHDGCLIGIGITDRFETSAHCSITKGPKDVV